MSAMVATVLGRTPRTVLALFAPRSRSPSTTVHGARPTPPLTRPRLTWRRGGTGQAVGGGGRAGPARRRVRRVPRLRAARLAGEARGGRRGRRGARRGPAPPPPPPPARGGGGGPRAPGPP